MPDIQAKLIIRYKVHPDTNKKRKYRYLHLPELPRKDLFDEIRTPKPIQNCIKANDKETKFQPLENVLFSLEYVENDFLHQTNVQITASEIHSLEGYNIFDN